MEMAFLDKTRMKMPRVRIDIGARSTRARRYDRLIARYVFGRPEA
jgi:hypothetical protein